VQRIQGHGHGSSSTRAPGCLIIRPPLSAGVTRGERLGPDFIDIVATRRLFSDDQPRALDVVRVADPIAPVTDSKHGCFALVRVPRPAACETTVSV
jgi:hypothetical protein